MSSSKMQACSQKPTLAEWLEREPFTLALSSGFFGFFAHAGFLSALVDRGLTPRALSGSSAGALVAGLFAAGLPPSEIRRELARIERSDFWDPGLGFGLLKGRSFEDILRRLVGDRRIEECTIPLQVSVFDVAARKTRVLTKGDLATAMRASCAFPGLFHPVSLEGDRCLDGGILDRPGLGEVPEGSRTLHHHLASKSPWRIALPHTVAPPLRKNQVTVVMHGLPRSGPMRLDRGRAAMLSAHARMTDLLGRPVEEGLSES